MIAALLFWALLLLCLAFATAYGGRDGRRISGLYLLNVILTVPASLIDTDWSTPQVAVLLVDLALLIALFWVVAGTRRWFPIWFTGFHMVGVTSHMGAVIAPGYAPKIYFLLQGLWALPMLLSLVIGVALDRKGHLRDDARTGAAG